MISISNIKVLFISFLLFLLTFLVSCQKAYYDDFIIDNVKINESEDYIYLDIDAKPLNEINIDGYNKMHAISVGLKYDEVSHLYINENTKNYDLENLNSISIDDSNSFYQPEEYNLLGKVDLNPYLDDIKSKIILPVLNGKKIENINIDGEVICKDSKLIISARDLIYDKKLNTFTAIWILGDYFY